VEATLLDAISPLTCVVWNAMACRPQLPFLAHEHDKAKHDHNACTCTASQSDWSNQLQRLGSASGQPQGNPPIWDTPGAIACGASLSHAYGHKAWRIYSFIYLFICSALQATALGVVTHLQAAWWAIATLTDSRHDRDHNDHSSTLA
jgi:hypothetical protein